jgi:glycine cleavage system H protein
MDGFSYFNIYETKGIEYLVIIFFLLMLIPFWILLNRQVRLTKTLQKVLGILTSGVLKVPQGLLYSKNHTWAHLEKSGAAAIGLDDLLLHLTGEVIFTRLHKPGDIIQKGELLTEIDHRGNVLRVNSPISGKILQVNPIAMDSPGMISEDPYGKGWIYKVKPTQWIVETNDCYLAEEATTWSSRELDRFKDFLANTIPKYATEPGKIILQEGGEIMDNPLSDLPPGVWKDFQQSFL